MDMNPLSPIIGKSMTNSGAPEHRMTALCCGLARRLGAATWRCGLADDDDRPVVPFAFDDGQQK
jgi:hypothetical protein